MGILRFLGKAGKGAATVTGAAAVILGLVGQTDVAQTVIGVGDGLGQVLVGAGTILASFGVGRKAGYAAKE